MNFPKSPRSPVSSRDSFSFLLLVFALICLHCGVALVDASAAGDAIKVTEGGRISADIVDLPLTRVLADLSQKLPMEIKGSPNGNERLTLHFSHLTLQDALRKIMAGYNYVLIEPEPAGGRLIITILGKVGKRVREAAVQSPPASETPVAASAPPASPAQLPTGQPVPSPLPNEAQPPVVAANPAPVTDTAATAPAAATTATPPGVLPAPDDQPEFNPAAWGGRGYRK
jgi:hypothetical protein